MKSHATDEAEIAVIVRDGFQQRGIGMELVRRLLEFARGERVRKITASVLQENGPMYKVFRRLGFQFKTIPGDEAIRAEFTF